MCNECLGKFANTKRKRSLTERLRSIAFQIKITYRVVRYNTSKRYATKWDAAHFVPSRYMNAPPAKDISELFKINDLEG